MDGERKRGADLIVVVMGWDGMGFTLLRGWDETLGKGRKRKRKRSNLIGEKRPSVPNRETEEWQCIHGVFLRSERGEFYRFERRILKRFLSWDGIKFDSVTNSPLQPTLSNGLARGIRTFRFGKARIRYFALSHRERIRKTCKRLRESCQHRPWQAFRLLRLHPLPC